MSATEEQKAEDIILKLKGLYDSDGYMEDDEKTLEEIRDTERALMRHKNSLSGPTRGYGASELSVLKKEHEEQRELREARNGETED